MIRRQGYRFRLKPTQADAALLRQFVRGEPRLRYQANTATLTLFVM